MTNQYTVEDFMEHTHVHCSFALSSDTAAFAGSQSVKDRLVKELEKFNFTNVVSLVNGYTDAEEKAFSNAMHNKKIYVTIHHLGRMYHLDPKNPRAKKVFRTRPLLNVADYIDNGKPAEYHIQIIGSPNSGKTMLANMVRKVLSEVCPTTEVIIVDTDQWGINFYYGNDAEREMFFTNIRHRKINVGIGMLKGN